MASTWEVSTTGGCDSLLIPRTYNDVTTNAKATEYYDNAVLALNTVLETADTVAANAEAAATSETNAATSESNAAASEAAAADSATLAESWAVGGTETRDGEDTDNAKYYAEQANTDYTAMDTRVTALEESTATEEAVAAEAALREAADTTLQENIDAEATTRGEADDALDSRVSALEESTATEEAVAAEAALREAADTTLQENIDAEATTRGEADDALDSRVSALEGATSISVGEYNVAQGSGALAETTTGEYNTALGYDAMAANTTGNHNVAVGYNALAQNTVAAEESTDDSEDTDDTDDSEEETTDEEAGNFNTAVGSGALASNTTGKYNVAIGYNAGCEVTDDDGNVLTAAITEGEGNITIGWECECDGTTTNNNGVCQPTTFYPSKHVDTDVSGTKKKDTTWKKYQISVGFMHGLYFPAGTTYGDIYAAINELFPNLGTSSGYYYSVSCCGSYSTVSPLTLCNTGSYIYTYRVARSTSGSWETSASSFAKGSTSTISTGLKLFFPSKQTTY